MLNYLFNLSSFVIGVQIGWFSMVVMSKVIYIFKLENLYDGMNIKSDEWGTMLNERIWNGKERLGL
jgi:hypothetical protein